MIRSKIVNTDVAKPPSWTQAVMALPSTCDVCDPNSDNGVVGEVFSTKNKLHQSRWFKDLAFTMADLKTSDGKEWEMYPTTLLRHMIEKLDKDHGLAIKAGIEVEFLVSDQ